MISKLTLSAATLAAAVFVATLPGSAATLGGLAPLKSIAAEQPSAVEQAHFWHRSCQAGLNGWHKHVKGVGRVQCTNHKCYIKPNGKERCFWY
jgi:hypothetical protein